MHFSVEARTSRDHYFLSPDFYELRLRVKNICLLTEAKQQWAMFSTWMGDRLSSRPAVGCVLVGMFLSPVFRKF